MTQPVTAADLDLRPANAADLPAIIDLATRALGWLGDGSDRAFFRWKHEENPFGRSPMWVACDGDRVVGFRTFLRWEFTDGRGGTVKAVRAVDTATDPEYQGRGIFTRLTLAALDDLRAEGVQMVFNTPNHQSLPGYLKMGWLVVGHLPVSVMPTSLRSTLTLAKARVPASRTAVIVHAGLPAAEAFADPAPIAALLDTVPPRPGLTTRKTPELLTWRYGHQPLHYRVMTLTGSPADGVAVFHLRRRGPAVEAVLSDVVVPDAGPAGAQAARALVRRIARESGADYLLRIDPRPLTGDPFIRIPRTGPILTFRRLDAFVPPRLARWHVGMGDIELF
jgi:GNAT superfamily N-acetyltransferase